MEALLMAEMDEEGVKCFLRLDLYPKTLANAAASNTPDHEVILLHMNLRG